MGSFVTAPVACCLQLHRLTAVAKSLPVSAVDKRREVILQGCEEACLTIQKEVELLLLTLKPEVHS